MREINVFISSPADVEHERLRAERVVERLNGQYTGVVRLIPIRWEQKFYEARASFQEQIPEAASCDLVIGIVWSRLGSKLPPEMPQMPSGEPYPSGTAYELLTAIEQSKAKGRPNVYLFRKMAPAVLSVEDETSRALVIDQLDRLKAFWERYVKTKDGHFKAGYHEFGNPDEFETQLEALLRGWLDERVLKGRAVVWPIVTKGSPFRGLAAFGAKHAPVFFGRDSDITRSVDLLKDAAERGSPFLLLVGSSGSGKSSLALAGLNPRLITPGVVGAVDRWRVAVMRPGEQKGEPMVALAQCLFDGPKDVPAEEEGRPWALPELGKSSHHTPQLHAAALAAGDAASVMWALDTIAEEARSSEGYDRPVRADLLLIVDQLDEVFAADVNETRREAFAKALAALVATGHVWLVATLRTDLYERLQQTPALLALKQKGAAYDLASPGPVGLAEIVRKPAEAAALIYERDETTGTSLDEQLLDDAGRPDMLPLLQFALSELFDRREVRGEATLLTFGAYSDIGGLDGAIDKRAEAALEGLGTAEQAALPRLLRQLAVSSREKGVGARLTIRSVPLSDAAPEEASKRLVQALIDARILLSSGDEGTANVRLAHERVLQSWKRARDIVRDNADFYRIRDDVEDQLERWQMSGKNSDLLIAKGVPLAEAESIAKRYPGELPPHMPAFITASRRRANRFVMLTGAAAAIFAVVAVAAAWQWRVAEGERARAERNFGAAKNAIDGLNGLIYNVAQGLQNVVGMRVDSVKSTLSAVSATIDALDKSAPDDVQLELSRARMLANFVDAYLAAGALKDAEGAAHDGLAAARAVAVKDPENIDAQRALAVGLYKVGDVKLKEGDTGGALQSYQESRDTARRLADREGNGIAQRLLWVALQKVGDAKLTMKDLPGALAAYEEGLSLARTRATKEPSNPEANRDLSISLAHVGAVQRAQRRYTQALTAYEESLGVKRQLATLHEGNKLARRDLALVLNDIGDTRLDAGDLDGALGSFNEAGNVFRNLAKEDPSDARAQRDVAVAFNNLGDLSLQKGNPEGARAAYGDSVAFLKPLVAIDEGNIPAKTELAGALIKLAGVSDDAEALYKEALDILQPLGVAGKLSEQQSGWIEMVKAQLAALGGN